MLSRQAIAKQLAAALLAGTWSMRPLESRTASYLGSSTRRWQTLLIADVLKAQSTPYPPSPAKLTAVLLTSENFDRAAALLLRRSSAPPVVLDSPVFAPIPAFAAMRAPRIETSGELARWLVTPIEKLDWLADEKRQHSYTDIPVLQNYTYRFLEKRGGGAPRLIEAPKAHLKALQRRILREILDLASIHPNVHGFVAGRSCLTGAHLHAGEHIVVCADLRDFFPSISAGRVHGLFRSFGYPYNVARLLTGLCATSTPASVFRRSEAGAALEWRIRKMYSSPHLAQGAPTSPALANLCAWRLDRRCAALAESLGGRYTRYADDLAFSGDEAFAQRTDALIAAVVDIARDEGFAINPAKTRIMRRARQQRVTGVVVNDHNNIDRRNYDRLKATLNNCLKRGPVGENREGHRDFRAHLDGRIGWAEQVNPRRGAKLRAQFEAIEWNEG